jgi:hypothetical protein
MESVDVFSCNRITVLNYRNQEHVSCDQNVSGGGVNGMDVAIDYLVYTV